MKAFNKSKTSLVLMEIIITICLFMVCGSLCIQFFVNAHLKDKETTELNQAILWSDSVVNVIDGYGNSIEGLENTYPLGGWFNDNAYRVYYDRSFELCHHEDAYYTVEVSIAPNSNEELVDISVCVTKGEEENLTEIYSINTKRAVNYYANDIE